MLILYLSVVRQGGTTPTIWWRWHPFWNCRDGRCFRLTLWSVSACILSGSCGGNWMTSRIWHAWLNLPSLFELADGYFSCWNCKEIGLGSVVKGSVLPPHCSFFSLLYRWGIQSLDVHCLSLLLLARSRGLRPGADYLDILTANHCWRQGIWLHWRARIPQITRTVSLCWAVVHFSWSFKVGENWDVATCGARCVLTTPSLVVDVDMIDLKLLDSSHSSRLVCSSVLAFVQICLLGVVGVEGLIEVLAFRKGAALSESLSSHLLKFFLIQIFVWGLAYLFAFLPHY